MAFSFLRSVTKSAKNFIQIRNIISTVEPKSNLILQKPNLLVPLFVISSRFSHIQPSSHQKIKKQRSYKSSASESDSDLEPPGHRGESLFWRKKIRTFHGIIDVNKDGVISYDDFVLLAERFIELGHLSDKHTEEFRKLMKDLWEKRWGPVNPYNLVTVEQFLEDMHHVINDKKLVRRAHSFLPYLFRAVDKDQSGEITEEEFKLFYTCLGLNEKDATLAFNCMDDNHDGIVTMRDFVKHGREFFLSEDENCVSKYFFGPLVDH